MVGSVGRTVGCWVGPVSSVTTCCIINYLIVLQLVIFSRRTKIEPMYSCFFSHIFHRELQQSLANAPAESLPEPPKHHEGKCLISWATTKV